MQLANCEGSILENESLLSSLNDSKIQAQQQKKALAESESMRKQFDEERNAYLRGASQGEVLVSLPQIHPKNIFLKHRLIDVLLNTENFQNF